MIEYLNEVYQVLNTFYKSTGLGIIFFDTELDLIACRPSKIIADDFICLGTNQITPFLTEKFALKPERKSVFYTFFLEGNLVCTIVMLAKNESFIGAFVTQPMFLKTHSQDETDALLEQICPVSNEKETFLHILLRVPVRAYVSLEPLGETLSSLSQTVFGDNSISQVMCGATNDVTEVDVESFTLNSEIDIDETLPLRQLRLSTYFKLKESIQNGDPAALDDIFGKISNGDLPTHQLDRSNYLRSLKNSYIKICSMACYAAIDANAPYYKLLDLTDELIRKVEKLENVVDIFNLMRKTLSDFARAVEISRIQKYSKPIRQVLDYINAHFDEKITLEMLAEQTNLSTFYLSTLIKKETGLMLMDNINAVRVEESKNLLLKNNTNVLDVAQQVGFLYQNHFSTVFKKFTGFTATEFVKATGTEIEKKGNTKKMSQTLQIIADRLRRALLMLPEMSATARIVDPINHSSWLVGTAEEDTFKGTCYNFWRKNKSCDNCI